MRRLPVLRTEWTNERVFKRLKSCSFGVVSRQLYRTRLSAYEESQRLSRFWKRRRHESNRFPRYNKANTVGGV